MSPIDDELRAMLQSRATDISPAPDPLGGIESRARGLRHRRAATAMAGAAAVVAAVAVAVPLALDSDTRTAVRTPAQSATPVADAWALDAQHPWAFRGSRDDAALATFASDYATAHPGASVSPLWGEVYEPSRRYEAALVAHGADGDRYAFAVAAPGGTDFVVDQPLPEDTSALALIVPGDEAKRLVVVASPEVDRIQYAPHGTTYTDLAELAPGVAVGPAVGSAAAAYRVLAADSSVVASGPVTATPDTPAGDPGNVLATWVHRGSAQTITDAAVVKAFGGGHYRSLYDGTSHGLSFTIGQAWRDGDAAAHTVALDSSGVFFLGPETPVDPWVLGAVFSTGSPTDLLVLLPRPGAGRIGYSPTATGAFGDVASGRSDLNPVGLVDRDPKATGDRVQVHRGDDSVILTEGIATLTCGAKDCG